MVKKSATGNRLLAIRHLAAWGRRLRNEGKTAQTATTALRHLVEAATLQGAQAIEEFQEAVQRSAKRLAPLGEPLMELDFTEHRWVAGHREEAHSDWLQWILANAEPAELLCVFGIDDPKTIAACQGSNIVVLRECRVREGHEGSTGRLDLLVELGDEVLLIVEIKLGEAEDADTKKNAGYCHSVEAEDYRQRFKSFVILVVDAEEETYFGFKPRLWKDVCIGFRLVAARLCRRGEMLKAGMILAYVGAVEQNMLKLQGMRHANENTVAAALALPRITYHLNQFLEADAYAKINLT